ECVAPGPHVAACRPTSGRSRAQVRRANCCTDPAMRSRPPCAGESSPFRGTSCKFRPRRMTPAVEGPSQYSVPLPPGDVALMPTISRLMAQTDEGPVTPLVLVANDQEWSARSLESILAPNGYAVVRAHTGQQALDQAR